MGRPRMSSRPEGDGDRGSAISARQGTFSEEALLASAAPDAIEPVAMASIYDTVMALRDGEVSWALVPIENSLEGSISVTLDLLAGDAGEVEIVGEALLRVSHSLIGAGEVALAEIETVITHPQVPGQCTLFLRSELAHARVLAAASTAEAVRTVVAERQARAGRAGHAAGGRDIRRHDRSAKGSRTATTTKRASCGWQGGRRRWTDRRGWAPAARGRGRWRGRRRWCSGARAPSGPAGWCAAWTSSRAGSMNLTKIESRPRRQRLGSYMFFADLARPLREERGGRGGGGPGRDVRGGSVLGSYPAAADPAPRDA